MIITALIIVIVSVSIGVEKMANPRNPCYSCAVLMGIAISAVAALLL